jgi:hypothetical protein
MLSATAVLTCVELNEVRSVGSRTGERLNFYWKGGRHEAMAMAIDDLDTARAAVAELASFAQTYDTKALLAASECARGQLASATGQDSPLASLRRSVALWREAGSPYESARAQMQLAVALDRGGQPDPSRVELTQARACFERLGARLDVQTAVDLMSAVRDRVCS